MIVLFSDISEVISIQCVILNIKFDLVSACQYKGSYFMWYLKSTYDLVSAIEYNKTFSECLQILTLFFGWYLKSYLYLVSAIEYNVSFSEAMPILKFYYLVTLEKYLIFSECYSKLFFI